MPLGGFQELQGSSVDALGSLGGPWGGPWEVSGRSLEGLWGSLGFPGGPWGAPGNGWRVPGEVRGRGLGGH